MEFLGRNETYVLFSNEDLAAVIDESSNTVVRVDSSVVLLASAEWSTYGEKPEASSVELANAAVTDLDIKVFSNGDSSNMYTIPDAVISEAKRGLAWRKEEKRGGTPVGLNTARTLAQGGQIGIQKIRHIAKYFPRHEVDKKGKGYKPGQSSYPSNGRIAWALWGGDAGKRWASAIVERDNKKRANNSVVASIEEFMPVERIDYTAFNPSEYEPDFYIRIRLDGSGIDRLYKVDIEGYCTVWDDGCWEDLGHIEHDFITYDKSLDDPYDQTQKIHVPVDRESAVKISAMLDNNPFDSVAIQMIDFNESDLIEKAIPEIDWKFLDQLSEDDVYEMDEWDDGLIAVGAPTDAPTNQDGNYTPEERSDKASKQVRDQLGKFAKAGSTVIIGNDPKYTGKILSINSETQEANVEFPNGNVVAVPANQTQLQEDFQPLPVQGFPSFELDTSGILGEPRVPIDEPTAKLPGRLPPLTVDSLQVMLTDWSSWMSDQRVTPEYTGQPVTAPAPAAGTSPAVDTRLDPNTVLGQYYTGSFNPDGTPKPGWNPATTENVYNNPLLRSWLDKKYNKTADPETAYHRDGWYKPSSPYGNLGPKVEGKKSAKDVKKISAADYMKKFDPDLEMSIISSAEGKKPNYEITPEKTDVAPMYIAIVAEDDPAAVMELVAVVPAGFDTNQPSTFKRRDRKWMRDERILADLNSPTPPPTIVLNTEQLADVVSQIDGGIVASARINLAMALTVNAITAAGGLDQNSGNAEKLRRYWTVGKGGLKIRWNSPGDWTRCHKYLSKYLGPRSKGYCALRHKEMTGMWPGDKRNPGMKKNSLVSSIEALRSEEQIIDSFTLGARAESAKAQFMGREGIKPVEHGAKFVIPLVIPEDKESGDGRIFDKGVIVMRDLPLPLLWQIKTGQGHDGSVVVGQITHMERIDGGIGNAVGVFDKGEYGREAERLVRNGFIRGVSADMDMFEANEEEASEDSGKVEAGRIVIKNARIMAVTIVPKPAFQECYIQIVDNGNEVEEEEMSVPDGIYVDGVNPLDASALVACGIVAGAIPVEPPAAWFENQKLDKPTPLTITDEGRVFGHIAAWHVDHIGMAFGTRPPKSRSKYSYFHTGVVRTAEGKDVPVGQLTLAGGHAGLEASADEAVRHYDDTASAFADVHAGEDAYGIWVSGALRSGTTPEQIRAARASAPSGDWRPIKGHLELVAVCQVNVPGFPIARARVASGQVMALVAAGANVLAQMKHDPLAELNSKIDALEAIYKQEQLSSLKSAAADFSARVASAKADADAASDYMIQMFDDNPESEMAVVTRRERKKLAEEGKALPDGSFPIRSATDLKAAIHAYGRAKAGKRGLVQKHIMKRARALGKEKLIPSKWAASVDESVVASMRERALSAAALIAETPKTSDKD
jgi:hypothetical protein